MLKRLAVGSIACLATLLGSAPAFADPTPSYWTYTSGLHKTNGGGSASWDSSAFVPPASGSSYVCWGNGTSSMKVELKNDLGSTLKSLTSSGSCFHLSLDHSRAYHLRFTITGTCGKFSCTSASVDGVQGWARLG